VVDLMDVDGDGWLDVIYFDGGQMYWHRKLPYRGLGWEETAQTVLEGVSLVSTQASIGRLEDETGLMPYAYQDDLGDPRIQSTPTIVFTEALTGFRDINGDGALDYIDTRALAGWEVWLGNGYGFNDDPITWTGAPVGWLSRSDEGLTQVAACRDDDAPAFPLTDGLGILSALTSESVDEPGPSYGLDASLPNCSGTSGRPSVLLGGLLDMDGDGRPDFVHGEMETWYRNLGDGFGPPQPLPDWFPRDHYGYLSGGWSAILSQSWMAQTVVTVPLPPTEVLGPGDSAASDVITTQLLLVGDVDLDGLPDVLDYRDQGASVAVYTGQSCGLFDLECANSAPEGDRPGLLSRIELGTGGEYVFGYDTSAVVLPSGQPDVVHKTKSVKPVLVRTDVTDSFLDEASTQRWFYEDGIVDHGKWLGFALVTEDNLAREWDRTFSFPGGGAEDVLLGYTATEYELDVDWALALTRSVYGDVQAPWVAGREAYTSFQKLLRNTTWTYDQFPVPTDILGQDHWSGGPFATLVEVAEYEQERSEPDARISESDFPTPREWSVEISYDEDWNVALQRHVVVGDASQTVEVSTEWAGERHGLFLPSSVEASYDIAGVLVEAEYLEFAYDGGLVGDAPTDGLLTEQIACSGPPGAGICGEDLAWTFEWTDRGAIAAVHAPLGRDKTFGAHTFGAMIPGEQRNALNHLVSRQADNLGRVDLTTDPNGVQRRTTYDVFGRPIATEPEPTRDTDEVVLTYGDRRWRVRGLSENTSHGSIRVNLLVSKGDAATFHVDVVELYSARQRGTFIAAAAAEVRVEERVLKKDLGNLLLHVERLVDERIRAALEPEKRGYRKRGGVPPEPTPLPVG
jgi:YD repeat-containing protein